MTSDEPAEAEIDPNRHYMALLGGDDNKIRIKFACGSGEDAVVSQVSGGLIRELEEDVINLVGGGPLFIDCSKHGKYLAFWQLLQKGPTNVTGGYPISMPLLLIPLKDVEHVISIGMR